MKKVYLGVILLLIGKPGESLKFPELQKEETVKNYTDKSIKPDYSQSKNLYKEKVKQFIKDHEGLRLKTYSCPGGYSTIGYGHVLRPNETFKEIDTSTAERILKKDIQGAVRMYNAYIEPEVNLNRRTEWVVIHLIYAKGIGNVNKHLLPVLKRQDEEELISTILNWNTYYSTKLQRRVVSDYSTAIREGEINFLKTGNFKWQD